MTTNLWGDEAYELFVQNQLTLLKKIVLTPLHLSVTVLRLKTNNVPFSAHGVMVFPLKKNLQAQSLPWYFFRDLLFVVTVFKDKIGNNVEATVDMANIAKAREFMTRMMVDPVYGKESLSTFIAMKFPSVMKIWQSFRRPCQILTSDLIHLG